MHRHVGDAKERKELVTSKCTTQERCNASAFQIHPEYNGMTFTLFFIGELWYKKDFNLIAVTELSFFYTIIQSRVVKAIVMLTTKMS